MIQPLVFFSSKYLIDNEWSRCKSSKKKQIIYFHVLSLLTEEHLMFGLTESHASELDSMD